MLFWSFVILLIIGVVLISIALYIDSDGLGMTGTGISICSIIAIIISLFIIGESHLTKDADIARFNARYDILVYQVENDVYENDNDLGKRDLYNDIQSWNEDLAYRKEAQRSLWLGIYYPDIYDQFEFISLDKED